MPPRRNSELECFVLGLVWQRGPCSPYDVRKWMADSPSTQWSGSAGAIYPLMQRLERRGLLSGAARRDGKRRRREYRATAKGLAALRAWIGPPLAAEAATVTHDPLRSRARFLEALSPTERRAWVAAARAALDEVERRVESWDAAYGDTAAGARLTRHGRLDVRFRREWLEAL